MKSQSIFISSYPLPLHVVSVGCLVGFLKHPTQDIFDPGKLPGRKPALPEVSEINNISRFLKYAHAPKLQLALGTLAKISLGNEAQDVHALETKRGAVYFLPNVDDWFEDICQFDQTQRWIERAARRGRKAYLVTALHTLKDVEHRMDRSTKVSSAVGTQVPLTAGLVGIPIASPLDPGAEIEYSKERSKKDSASIPSEMIYAIQYREVRVKKGNRSTLKQKIFWEPIFSERGASDEEMGDVDNTVIEAQLLDVIEDYAGLSPIVKQEEGLDLYVTDAPSK